MFEKPLAMIVLLCNNQNRCSIEQMFELNSSVMVQAKDERENGVARQAG
jgi:hypothetical protein